MLLLSEEIFIKSGRSDLNRRHSAWKADVLPLNYTRRKGGGQSPRHMHATNFIISDAKLENNHTEGDLPPTYL
tara:strand:- start:81 stop:299 length:219 start_codon:yes stop_codon:yes gene_type:complete